jgi:peptidoglycan biosynthesis protein MviN/MurJ (putative lipid II flippase)
LLGAAALAGLVAWALNAWWTRQLGHATLWFRLGQVFVPMTGATLIYFGVSLWARVPAAEEMLGFLRRRLG